MLITKLIAGPGVSRAAGWAKGLGRRIAVVSEPRAFASGGQAVLRALRAAGEEAFLHLLPAGEAAKAWAPVERLMRDMLKKGVGRDGAVVAVGGGAVTDAAGFAAAIYMRGIPWVSVPTTLLGQLDGGLGGKTAVNLPEGKNLAGAFHQPRAVVCDTSLLRTLTARDRLSGLAEAVKIGLVFDPALWRYIEREWDELMDGREAPTARVVRAAAAWKLRIVAQDERETAGRRELLNFGHTFGHAIEAAAGPGTLRHGEAVILGMRAALRLSEMLAGLPPAEAAPVLRFLQSLPVRLPRRLSARELVAAARLDKKARQGRLRFVLLSRLGRPVVAAVPEDKALRAALSLMEK